MTKFWQVSACFIIIKTRAFYRSEISYRLKVKTKRHRMTTAHRITDKSPEGHCSLYFMCSPMKRSSVTRLDRSSTQIYHRQLVALSVTHSLARSPSIHQCRLFYAQLYSLTTCRWLAFSRRVQVHFDRSKKQLTPSRRPDRMVSLLAAIKMDRWNLFRSQNLLKSDGTGVEWEGRSRDR